MAARRRHIGPAPFVRRPATGPPVVSIRELRWNARLGVVTQLVYIVGRLPRRVRLVAGVVTMMAAWLTFELVVALWPFLLALVAALVAWRYGRPRLAAWRQYRRDRAEALEVLGDDDEPPHDGIPY